MVWSSRCNLLFFKLVVLGFVLRDSENRHLIKVLLHLSFLSLHTPSPFIHVLLGITPVPSDQHCHEQTQIWPCIQTTRQLLFNRGLDFILKISLIPYGCSYWFWVPPGLVNSAEPRWVWIQFVSPQGECCLWEMVNIRQECLEWEGKKHRKDKRCTIESSKKKHSNNKKQYFSDFWLNFLNKT